MEAYHIDRFGSVDGIVLRSSEDPRPGLREVLTRVLLCLPTNRLRPSRPSGRGGHGAFRYWPTAPIFPCYNRFCEMGCPACGREGAFDRTPRQLPLLQSRGVA